LKGINKTIAYRRFGEYLSYRSVIIAKRDLDAHLRYVTRLNGISPRGESPLSMSLEKVKIPRLGAFVAGGGGVIFEQSWKRTIRQRYANIKGLGFTVFFNKLLTDAGAITLLTDQHH